MRTVYKAQSARSVKSRTPGHITKSATKNMCYCIWLSILLLSGIHEGIRYAIMHNSMSMDFISSSLLTFLSTALQCSCFGRILYVIRSRAKRNPPRADGSPRFSGNFLCIAVWQMVAFVLCTFPQAVFISLHMLKPEIPLHPFIGIFRLLARFNSLVDPILFFVVFKDKLMTQRNRYQVRFDGAAAYVIPRRDIQPT